MRVSELANELGKTSKEILEIIKTKDQSSCIVCGIECDKGSGEYCALFALRGTQNLPHRAQVGGSKTEAPGQKLQEQRHLRTEALKQRLQRQRPQDGASRESRLRRS